jgi:hypothetical protein
MTEPIIDRPTLAEAIAKTLCEFDCGGGGGGNTEIPCPACQDEGRVIVPTVIAWYADQGIDLLEFRG